MKNWGFAFTSIFTQQFYPMKQNISALKILSFVLLVLFAFTSCKNKSQMLLKSWKVENLKYTKEVPEDLKPAIEHQINEMRKNFLLTYNADGTYTTTLNNQNLQGKWKLNWNSTKIETTSSQGEVKDFTIEELTDKTFHFKVMEGKEEVTFLMVASE